MRSGQDARVDFEVDHRDFTAHLDDANAVEVIAWEASPAGRAGVGRGIGHVVLRGRWQPERLSLDEAMLILGAAAPAQLVTMANAALRRRLAG